MSKLPALQFYPGDWFRDAAVQSLTTLERGIWFELLLLMHDSPCRGKLLISTQKVYPKTALSRRFGMRPKRLDTILDKFVSYGVADICEETGALMCRRMVRETEQNLHMQKVRKAAANKRWNRCKTDANHDAKVMQNHALSSSSSSSGTKKKTVQKKKVGKTMAKSRSPTLQEIQSYAKSRNSSVDPRAFFDYFEAGGWIDSKGKPVIAWKQKFITWEMHERKAAKRANGETTEKLHDWEAPYPGTIIDD